MIIHVYVIAHAPNYLYMYANYFLGVEVRPHSFPLPFREIPPPPSGDSIIFHYLP